MTRAAPEAELEPAQVEALKNQLVELRKQLSARHQAQFRDQDALCADVDGSPLHAAVVVPEGARLNWRSSAGVTRGRCWR
jgi:hypothetical protein